MAFDLDRSRRSRLDACRPGHELAGVVTALGFGTTGLSEFVDFDNDGLEDVGEVDLVFDVIGGDIAKRSAGVIRAGGTLVTVTGPTEVRPSGGLTIDFVVEPRQRRSARTA